jgi:hypothetical protein
MTVMVALLAMPKNRSLYLSVAQGVQEVVGSKPAIPTDSNATKAPFSRRFFNFNPVRARRGSERPILYVQ